MAAIEVEGLGKSFEVAVRDPGIWGALRGVVRRRHRRVDALVDVGFEIEAGELVGYIGPNGAGKSTTVKVLAGILVPTSGRCQVLGRVPWIERKEHVAHIGAVFGQRTQLWWDLPVVESFELLRDIYRVSEGDYRRQRDELVELLSLAGLLDTPVRQLSLGQRMRCDLAASLLHAPDILFLDEPTIGLDAPSKLAVRDFVRTLNRERGVTVILTTHDMDDVEALCSRVMVLGQGRLLSDGSLTELRRRVGAERRLIVDLVDLPGEVEAIEGAELVAQDGHRLQFAFDPDRTTAASLIARVSAEHPVHDLFVEDAPIEEWIGRLYAQGHDDARDDEA